MNKRRCGASLQDIAAEHSEHLSYIEILTDQRAAELHIRARWDAVNNSIIIRQPKTIANFWLFLHECGHSKLHKDLCYRADIKSLPPYHMAEVEAEFYAYKAMHRAGISVPEEVITGSVSHVVSEAIGDACAGFPVSQLVLAYCKSTKTERLLQILKKVKEVPRTTELLATWYSNVDHPILQEMPQTGTITHEGHIELAGYCKAFGQFEEVFFE
jgi:hypothetical protein